MNGHFKHFQGERINTILPIQQHYNIHFIPRTVKDLLYFKSLKC